MSDKQLSNGHLVSFAALLRDSIPEVLIQGAFAWHDGQRFISSHGSDIEIPARSLLKPWQLLATNLLSQQSDVSMALASHNGTESHIVEIEDLARRLAVGEGEILCPKSWPMDPESAFRMKEKKFEQRSVAHPCAGKHLAIVAACKQAGWDPSTYGDLDHPYHQALKRTLKHYGFESQQWLMDSCGVPTPVCSLVDLADLWRNLALDGSQSAEDLKKCMWQFPGKIGGTDRLDSQLLEAGKSHILAKEGADGLLVIQSSGDDLCQTLLIKLASGYNRQHLVYAGLAVLESQKQTLGPAMKIAYDHLVAQAQKSCPSDQNLLTFEL